MFGGQGPLRAYAALGGLALAMGALVTLGALVGMYLDRRWGTGPWLTLVGTLLGFAAGLFEVITAVNRAQQQDSADSEEERKRR